MSKSPTVDALLSNASKLANAVVISNRFADDANAVAASLRSSGITGLSSLNGTIGFFAQAYILSELSDILEGRSPEASKAQFMQFCAAAYDVSLLNIISKKPKTPTKKPEGN